MIRAVGLAFGLLLALATGAQAGPVFFAVLAAGGGIGAAFGATVVGSFLTATFVGRLLTSVALSALSAALAPKPRPPGIKTSVTQTGGANPQSFVLGRYATAGVAVSPAMSHGDSRGRLTYVINLGDVPGMALRRVIVNDEFATIDIAGGLHPDGYGYGVTGTSSYDGWMWVKFYDGSQLAADPYLLATYGTYPDRPWTSDMIGLGVCYAICTFRFKASRWSGLPSVAFEVDGIPLYDPRLDTTVGGSGAHRWADPTTWEGSDNPAVQIYNICRGIALPDGSVWGGGFEAADLPLSNWFAAMNECDVAIDLDAGGTEPQYRTGIEVTVDEEPAAVIEELLKGCSGAMAEVGGVWKIRVGAAALPVYLLTDDDVLISRSQDLDPFPGLDGTYNGVQATYPEPEQLWEAKDAPPRYDAGYEAEDDGRRLVAELSLNAVWVGTQVQRLMKSNLLDARRFRRHTLSLPPDAAILEPLDAVAWTSARHGYDAEVFEITQVADGARDLVQTVAARRRDPGDFEWSSAEEVSVVLVPPGPVLPDPATVPSFAVTAVSLDDGVALRLPALGLTWDPAEIDGAYGLAWEVRLDGGSVVEISGTTQEVEAGALTVAQGVLSLTAYEVRARLVADTETAWTSWLAVTTTGAGEVGVTLSPIDQRLWHPYDAVTYGDGNDGVIYDSAVNGTVSSITSADFDPGYEYAFDFDGVTIYLERMRVRVWRVQTGAYGAWETFTDTSGTVAYLLFGRLNLRRPTLVGRMHLLVAEYVFLPDGTAVTRDGKQGVVGVAHATPTDLLRAQFSLTSGNIAVGRVVQLRRLLTET